MNPDSEMQRLRELMPASGRMLTQVVSQPQQSKVIEISLPVPWNRKTRRIPINFDLWRRLSKPQRDLLLLRAVSWLTGVQWFKPDIYQGITLAGLLGTVVELSQGDAIGVIVAGGLTAISVTRIWRNVQSTQRELDADEAALKVAQRRGYTRTQAAESLLSAIEAVAEIEQRPSLNFIELLRSQNLRAIANLSPVGVPQRVREE